MSERIIVRVFKFGILGDKSNDFFSNEKRIFITESDHDYF